MKDLPSPRQLEYLVALSATSHFGRAAARCHVTQSTLSAGLKELETVLRITLAERTKRRVLITPLGRAIAARASEILRYYDDLMDLAAGSAKKLSGPLHIGVIPTIAPYLIPSAMSLLHKAFPDLKIYLREEQTEPLLARLRRGELELGLIALPYETGNLSVMRIADEHMVACLPAKHELGTKKSITPAMLLKAPLLTLESGHCWREHAWSACQPGNRRPNEVFHATSLPTIVQMVAEGLGMTLLPRMAVARETSGQKGIVVREISSKRPARTIALVWRSESVRGEDFVKIAAILRQACETLAAPATRKGLPENAGRRI
jgi:LysR family transcriptional regulator, hydrogen peroxide-inducible genes activator